jgi:hypothetical protein
MGKYPEKYWTDERLEELAALTERGWSDARIGKHFGRTANAIANQRHRLKVSIAHETWPDWLPPDAFKSYTIRG